jgi:hypothetical protein
MQRIRLASLIFTSLIAASLIAAAAASASAPEFSPGTLNISVGEGSTSALETSSTAAVTCTKVSSTGEITGVKTVGGVVVTLIGCSSKEGTGCSVKSAGQAAGTVVTTTLSGELGSVKKTEAASGVGMLVSPASGTKLVELEAPCILVSPASVVGTMAGEVTPVNDPASTDGKLVFEGSKGAAKIKSINVLGTVEDPELKALGLIKASEAGAGLELLTNPVTVT